MVPRDGIGREVTPAALEVLEAAGRAHGFGLEITEYPWGCDHFLETGRMMPVDALDTLRSSEAIFLGAVGHPDVPDHVSLWGLLIPVRRRFRQYVNLRPIRLWPGHLLPAARRHAGAPRQRPRRRRGRLDRDRPSGNVNHEREFPSMFEPASDIAGQGIANPIGATWSGAQMLDHLGEAEAAAPVLAGLEATLAGDGPRTRDPGGTATTAGVTAALVSSLSSA